VLPRVVIFLPLTITRPWTIRASALRRDVTPACAMTLCNRTSWVAKVLAFTSEKSFIFQRLRLSVRRNCRGDLRASQRQFPMPPGVGLPPPCQLTSHVDGIEYAARCYRWWRQQGGVVRQATGLLSKIQVVELAQRISGPYCGKI